MIVGVITGGDYDAHRDLVVVFIDVVFLLVGLVLLIDEGLHFRLVLCAISHAVVGILHIIEGLLKFFRVALV